MNLTRQPARRRLACALAAATLGLIALPGARAEAPYPSRPVTLVVPFSAGGATDTVGRILAKAMGERLGQSVVVDNKPGAGTELGAAAVARAQPDGHTLLISSNSTFVVNPALKPRLQYSPEASFDAVGFVGAAPLVILAQPGFAASSVKDLVAMARSKPGKLSYASFGAGTTSHLAGEMFKVMAGADIVHVPYKGSAPAMADLLGGQVELSIDTVVAALPMLKSGKVKVLATTSPRRTTLLPQVPTVAEAGYPGYEMTPWLAIVGPRGLSPAVQQKLSSTLAAVVADPAIKAQLEQAGIDVKFEPPAAYAQHLARELPLVRAYVRKAQITLD